MDILKNKKIIAKAVLISSFFGKISGLMFKKQKNIVFDLKKEKREIIHMFFVFYKIDLVFLNENKVVVELKKSLMPFSMYSSKKFSRYILELKKDSIKENNLKVGDKISF